MQVRRHSCIESKVCIGPRRGRFLLLLLLLLFVRGRNLSTGSRECRGRAVRSTPKAMMQEHKSFLIRDLLGDVLADRVQGIFTAEGVLG